MKREDTFAFALANRAVCHKSVGEAVQAIANISALSHEYDIGGMMSGYRVHPFDENQITSLENIIEAAQLAIEQGRKGGA